MITKIFSCAHVPEDLAQQWLQHLRDFDTKHPGCHFEVYVDTPDVAMKDVIQLMQVKPGLTFAQYFERAKESKP